jgi:aldehyde:ferredoxin oxidoreductase
MAMMETTRDIEEGFIGGRGTNTKLFYDISIPGVDPLSDSCPIIFGTGPLTGTTFPMAGRYEVTSISPLTGTIFTSSCGGRLGLFLKRNLIDTLIIKGRSEVPSYIFIEDGEPSIHLADAIWGRQKGWAKGYLKERHGPSISIAMIGKAGEMLVPFANIENDSRFIGRGGLGAVLGAKNIKAIVVKKGRERPKIADANLFSSMAYQFKKWLTANPITSSALPEFGTGVFLNYMREKGLISTMNFRAHAPPEAMAISGEMLTEKVLKKRMACPFCSVACGRVTENGRGPEFEGIWSLGVNLGIYAIEKVIALNNLCNELGLDTISTGAVLAMAAELSEEDLLPFKVTSSSYEEARSIIEEMAAREGRGKLLSYGTKRLGELCDRMAIAPQVKGLELPAYDPRGAYGHALGYATSNRGGCHLQGNMIGVEILGIPKLLNRFAVEGKASLLALYQNVSAFMDCLVLCRFASFAIPHDYYSRIATIFTEKKVTWEDSIRIGERIWNLERLINLREGVEKDSLPARFKEVPLEGLLKEYYEIRGWDDNGVPKEQRLCELGLHRKS